MWESLTGLLDTPIAPCDETGYPGYTVWALWLSVVAVMTWGLAEWPKRWWFKPTRAWMAAETTVDKMGLLSPLLMTIGGALGGYLFLTAGMMRSLPLCIALGMAVGILSAPIRDAVLKVIEAVPKAVKKRLGVSTEQVPTVDEELPRTEDISGYGEE